MEKINFINYVYLLCSNVRFEKDMNVMKFNKGDFITQASSRNNSFAIFEGNVYEPREKGGPNEYSLMCFYNPDHYVQDSNGNFIKEYVFECSIGEDTCDYIIDDTDMQFWRKCTPDEVINAIKFLANEKKIAYDDKKFTLRKLAQNETLRFDAPSNVNNTYYHRNEIAVTTKKTITRIVNENWEQKEPICCMNDERSFIIKEQCKKLMYSFSDYSNCIIYGDYYGCYD